MPHEKSISLLVRHVPYTLVHVHIHTVQGQLAAKSVELVDYFARQGKDVRLQDLEIHRFMTSIIIISLPPCRRSTLTTNSEQLFRDSVVSSSQASHTALL